MTKGLLVYTYNKLWGSYLKCLHRMVNPGLLIIAKKEDLEDIIHYRTEGGQKEYKKNNNDKCHLLSGYNSLVIILSPLPQLSYFVLTRQYIMISVILQMKMKLSNSPKFTCLVGGSVVPSQSSWPLCGAPSRQ